MTTPIGDHLGEVDDHLERRLLTSDRHVEEPFLAMDHEVGQAAQLRPISTGNADELRDHVHRDLAGEVGDEVERAVRKGWLQVLDGDLSHPVLELGHGPRREALVGELADPGVLGRIHGQERHGLAGV